MTEQELKALLQDMTLEEKIDQMNQVMGGFFTGEITAMGPLADKGFTKENVSQAGSILGATGAETLKKIQKAYMENQPHKIPMLFMISQFKNSMTSFDCTR